jgi:putative ABC transport system permease protein
VSQERIFSWLLYLYPRDFRQRYGTDLVAFFRQEREHPKYKSGPLRPLRFWTATVRDLLRSAWSHRLMSFIQRADRRSGRVGLRSFVARLPADLRSAWRSLWSAPGVTVSALAVLTLGIGASTAIFSVVDAVALRGLPFADAGRLVSVAETDLARGRRLLPVAPQDYAAWRARQAVFEDMAASAYGGDLTPAPPSTDPPFRAVRITASLFDVVRARPALGRPFQPSDERAGAAAVAIISDRLWRHRFQADPGVIGRTIALERGPITIVGVMPPGFAYPIGPVFLSTVDCWLPLEQGPHDAERAGRGRTYNLSVVARLRPGLTVGHANSAMQQIRDALAIDYPTWFVDRGVVVLDLQEAIVGTTVRAWMLFLLGAVGCVLLIACLNVASLLVARATARSHEVALRSALGASRGALVRALMVESLLLAMLGAVSGVLLAFWGVAILRAALPEQLPRLTTIAVDLRVLAVTAITAATTGLLFGIVPALQLSRADAASLLRQGGRSQTIGGTSQRLRSLLVTAEVALAVVLFAGAALFLSSFLRVLSVDLGLNPQHVLSVDVSPGSTPRALDGTPIVGPSQRLIMQALNQTQALPGVVAAAVLSSGLPLSGNSMTVPVQVGGRQATPFSGNDEAAVHGVTPGYLDVMRATLLRGRWTTGADVEGSAPVVVLNDEAMRRYFAGQDPLGQTILLNGSPRTVVGVVAGARLQGPESAVPPEAYIPFVQSDQASAAVVIRTVSDPSPLAPLVQAAIRSVMPGARISAAETVEQHFSALIAQRKFTMIVLTLFGSLAVLIAAVGLYGLMAFLVALRTREIGVRMALGAAPVGIVQMVLGQATRLILVGLVVGLLGTAWLERLVQAFLFQGRSHDPVMYAIVAAVLFATGLIAALGPARTASQIDPFIALRTE